MERFRRLGVHRGAHKNGVWCVSPASKVDGCDFVTGGADGSIAIWALRSGTETAAGALNGNAVPGEVANGNENVVPVRKTGSNDNELSPLSLVARLKHHSLGVVGVAIAAEGTIGTSTSLDGTLKLWDAARPDEPSKNVSGLSTNLTEIWAVAVSPDGKRVVTGGSGGSLHVIDTEMAIEEEEFNYDPDAKAGEAPMCMSVAFSFDGSRLAVGAQDGTVRVFNGESCKPLTNKIEGHSGPVRSVSFVPGESSLVSTSDDGLVNYYDIDGEHLAISLRGHSGMVLSAAPSSCGKYVATGSSDKMLKIWDRKFKEQIFSASEHSDSVWGVAFVADGSRLVSVCDDGGIAVLDSENADKVVA
eukprot:Plantae.Rhodophyta-Palmaria_palmata.ctg323.p1 GENE.Plantae.Rhodophyta-Palmaria_palmata.ctg323~~Plantae.Rhodophyta-Palmaria_palmata.ctg323.p1  ORF type:complete len:359 (-),score=57.31 Plantae.Rhodophyta-Palmaria_palmata.ctg323:425-1501(-)